ncbi:MAG TPA: DUF6766 family protein [Dehalococcoidia bacterium]|nr:DUF6766 family protein [Dehalococcoidia bacterium]
MERLIKDYNLSLVLFLLFISSWIAQLVTQMVEFRDEAQAHGESFALGGFIPVFARATFENWQSEFLQLLTFVVLTSFLIHRGSHESKDEGEQMMRKLDAIESELKELRQTRVS